MKNPPVNLILLFCFFSLLCRIQIYSHLTQSMLHNRESTIMGLISDKLKVEVNGIPLCSVQERYLSKNHSYFFDVNSGVQTKRYSLGYWFNDNLTYYRGKVRIKFGVTEDNVKAILLHSSHHTIKSFKIRQVQYTSNMAFLSNFIDFNWDYSFIRFKKICKMSEKSDILLISFNKKLPPTLDYLLEIRFKGTPSNGINGIYRTQYQVPIANNSILNKQLVRNETIISTFFQTNYARTAFPCFDEPSMKAVFRIYLTHPKSMKSFSNMPISKKIKNNNGTVTVYFEQSPRMSTYLVAFSINNYSVKSIVSDSANKSIVSIILPSHMIDKGDFALDVAKRALNLFESLTLIPYGIKKLDLIGIPSFQACAMENWGLITFRLQLLIMDNETTSSTSKEHIAEVVSHEVSHQWFGNYVTMKKWNDLWLNEGFATFMKYYVVGRLFPDWNISMKQRTLDMDNTIDVDELATTHAMVVSENYTNIESLFDGISYLKSANVLAMLHYVIGDNKFWKVMRKYLNKYAYSSVSSRDLSNVFFEEIDDRNVHTMINSWTSNEGLPVVTVKLVNKTNQKTTILFYQRRFLISSNRTRGGVSHIQKWTIPIKYQIMYKSNSTTQNSTFWLTEATQHLEFNGTIQSIIINMDRIGFFVSQYDSYFWNQIINKLELEPNIFSTIDRVMFLSDSMRLSRKGMIEIDISLRILMLLINNSNYYIRKQCLKNLNNIGWILNENNFLHDLFKKFMRDYLQKIYQQVDFANSNMEMTTQHKLKLLNTVSLMCVKYNCSKVINMLENLYKKWITNGTKIEPNLLRAVLWTKAIHGTLEDINLLEAQYQTVNEPHLKYHYLTALTQVQNQTILKKYMNESVFGSMIPLQDITHFFSYLALNKCATTLTWKFLKKNWSAVKAKSLDSIDTLSSILLNVASQMKNTKKAKELEEFYIAHNDTIHYNDYKKSMEQIMINADYSSRVQKAILSAAGI